jgi:hypothetical protein
MHVVVASHGHCFDGLASAVLFTHLLRELDQPLRELQYHALGYGPEERPTETLLKGDINAVLDYRFSPSPALNWYFDHHRTAFASREDHDVFEARKEQGQFFHTADYSICTKLIAEISREQFKIESPALAELVRWADRIDSANFPSAEAAIDGHSPILRLANVVEHHGDDAFFQQFAPLLLTTALDEVAQHKLIQSHYAPLAERRERYLQLVRQHARLMGRVVFVDLTATPLHTLAKFVTYALFPRSMYSVIVGRLGNAIKISIGHNPWCGEKRRHDIGAMCAQHGGGGHAMVGGIAFPFAQLTHALEIAQQIAQDLDSTEHAV